jgi:CubicO group peptidase (beta-lactamase class C family)
VTQADPRIQQALEIAVGRGEVGVHVAAYLGEKLIVDAWIGPADAQTGRTCQNAIFPIFSVTKATLITAIHLQAERGLLDIDAPIASYWPVYAQNGKGSITPRHVLTHRGGVHQMPAAITPDRMGDWDWIVGELAKVEPAAPAGEVSIYHAMSFGFILGEVLRRTDPKHRSPGSFIHEELFARAGVEDFWVGLPMEQEPRVAKLTWGQAGSGGGVVRTRLREEMMPAAIDVVPEIYNLPQMHQAVSPAAGGVGSARGVAKFFGLLANGGGGLISEARLRSCLEVRPNPDEIDAGIGMPTRLGAAGFQLGGAGTGASPVLGASPTVLAHGGAGGSIGWADLDSGLAVAITHNRMFGAVAPGQHPFQPLADAVREIAAEQS